MIPNHPTSVGSSIFNTVSNSEFVHAHDTGVCRCCHGVFIQRTVQVHVWIDTGVCGLRHGVFIQRTVEVQVWIMEERSLKVREMQEPQEYAQTQV